MTGWFSNPVVQAGLVPFVISLVVGLLFKRLGWFWAGLALTAGFAVAVYWVAGFTFHPWTSIHKIVALIFGAAALGLLLDLYPWDRQALSLLLFVSGGIAALWVVWPVLQHHETLHGAGVAVGVFVYAGWCAAMLESLRDNAVRTGSALVTINVGTGVAALLSASALLGQLAGAIGAAAGALLLLAAFARRLEIGSLAALPGGLAAGLLGGAGCVYARMPWYDLMVLALIPLLARVPLPRWMTPWMSALSLTLICAVAAGAAVWIALRVGGAPPF